MRVFLIGYPSDVGGANTECWHLIRLLQRVGVEVTLVPTWEPGDAWRARTEAAGFRTVLTTPQALSDVEGLSGAVCVVLCNTKFLACAPTFRKLGCRIVWLGCMNWLFAAERLHYGRFGPFDRHVFHSHYQRDQLWPQLERFGCQENQAAVIRGAFLPDDFCFQPLRHAAGERFLVGRIGRDDADKFPQGFWRVFERLPHPTTPKVLGWKPDLQDALGATPPSAECLPIGAQSAGTFLPTLHALVQLNSAQTTENWPRVGLEAMAAGVPIVADDRGGWREMIRHGETGYLVRTTDQAAYFLSKLAYEEDTRLRMAVAARCAVEDLSDQADIGGAWRRLLEGMETAHERSAA